jgi:hypothetical protein
VPQAAPVSAASGGIAWSQIAWGALAVAVIVGIVVVIANQPKSSGSGGSYGY